MEGLGAFSSVTASTRRLLDSIATLSDDQIGEPTLIPPWTRGHVITHIARAADSYRRLLAGAIDDIEVPQYPSMQFRSDQIEAGANRSVAELLADVEDSSARFERTMRSLPEHAWQARVRMRPGELRRPAELPLIRIREVELHHVDLAVGYTFSDIPTDTARWVIEDILMEWARRDEPPAVRFEAIDTGLTYELGVGAPLITGNQAELLGWLSGRAASETLTVEGPTSLNAPTWI